MSYIGKEPQIGSYSMLDNLTASATASYSLTLDSVAFVPESANHLIVSLNGVIQKAGSSFTVSGSTLTFSSALTSSDSIDFVLALGNVLDIGTPSDATVTNAKTNFVSTSSAAGLQIKGDGTTDGTLQLNCSQNSHGIKLKSPAHSASQSYTLTFPTTSPSADKFLKTDGSGNLSFADAGGITVADNWRLNADDAVDSSETDLDTGWERVDTTGQGTIGSAMSQSSGVFTFPSTGIYLVQFQIYYVMGTGADYGRCVIRHRTSGGTMTDLVDIRGYAPSGQTVSIYGSTLMDIQSTTNDLVIFYGGGNVNGNVIAGNTNINRTSASFIRLGNT